MPAQYAPSSLGPFTGRVAAATQPYRQFNLEQPYREKMALMNAIIQFAETQAAKRRAREAERAGGGPLGSGLGAGLGGLIGTIVAPGAGTAIGAGLGAQTGGAIGTAVSPPGGPAGAQQAAAFQNMLQGLAPLAGATVGGLSGMSQQAAAQQAQVGPSGVPLTHENIALRGMTPTQAFGRGFGQTLARVSPFYGIPFPSVGG